MSKQDAMPSAVGWDGMECDGMGWHDRSKSGMATVLPDQSWSLMRAFVALNTYPRSNSKRSKPTQPSALKDLQRGKLWHKSVAYAAL